MTINSFSTLPPDSATSRQVSQVVNLLVDGKSNNLGTLTLSSSSTTTVVTDLRVGENSCILLMPTTSNAANENVFVSSRGKQTFTLTHANASTTDRSFVYAVIG